MGADVPLKPITSTSRLKASQRLSGLFHNKRRDRADFASYWSPSVVTTKPWPLSKYISNPNSGIFFFFNQDSGEAQPMPFRKLGREGWQQESPLPLLAWLFAPPVAASDPGRPAARPSPTEHT